MRLGRPNPSVSAHESSLMSRSYDSIEQVGSPPMLLAFVLCWLLPLAAGLRVRGGSSGKHPNWAAFEAKMVARGLSTTAIRAFEYNFEQLTSGKSLFIGESEIEPVDSLPVYDFLDMEDPQLLEKTVVLKLNGGLGTGMGLEQAKSLLPIRNEGLTKLTFLDFIAKQVRRLGRPLGDRSRRCAVPTAPFLLTRDAVALTPLCTNVPGPAFVP